MRKYELITYEKHGDQSQVVDLTQSKTRVLEVGCASGPITRRLKKKGCQVVGIEINPILANKAKKYCQKVLVGDVEKMEKLPYPQQTFDIIIYSNILEHLKDPLTVLKNLDIYLKKNGYIVVVLPNIAHWLFRLELLLGKFKYRPCGVLDETHLRFYTRDSGKKLLKKAGYKIAKFYFTISGLHLRPIKRFAILQKIIYIITRLRPTLFAPQFLFIGEKSKKK